jgi:hypothetical protein
MKRIDIHYGGEHYSTGGREVTDVRGEVQKAITSGQGWLEVNEGEGDVRTAYLLLSPGVALAVVPVPDEGELAGESDDSDGPDPR